MTLQQNHDAREPDAPLHRSSMPRRRIDLERYAVLGGLLGTLVSIGIAWDTASATVSQKVDRTTFEAHVAEASRRFLSDSMRGSNTDAALHRIEMKQDSTNHRLQLLVCENKPTYCQ